MEGFQLRQIGIDDPLFLEVLAHYRLSTAGLERAEAYQLVEQSSGQPLAFSAIEIYAPHAMLRSLATIEEHRGQGYAATLCRHILAQSAARGVTHVYALTETAREFFDFMGFDKVSRNALPSVIARSPLVEASCGEGAEVFRLSL